MISSTLLALTMGGGLVQAKSIEIPFEIADNAIFVDGLVNGKKTSLLFDTGYSGVVIMGDHLNLGKITGTKGMRDFVTTFTVQTTDLKSLSVGGYKYKAKDETIDLMPSSNLIGGHELHMDGILGMQTFNDTVLEVNYQKKKLVVHPKTLDVTKWKPDNKRTFLINMLPYGVDHIILDTFVNSGQRLRLAFDTGNAFYLTTHKDSIERVGLWKPGRKPDFMSSSGVASGSVDRFNIMVENSKICGIPVPSSVWGVIDRPAVGATQDGTVGHDFLKHFNWYLDPERRVIWADNWSGKATDGDEGEIGALAAFHPTLKRLVFYQIMPKGPADKAGLKLWDMLLAIDGQDVKDLSGRRIRKMLEGPVGSKIKITVSRAGNLIHFDLERKLMANTTSK